MQARRRAQPSGTNSPSSSHPRWKAPSAMRHLRSVPAMRPPGSPRCGVPGRLEYLEPRGSAPRERDHRGGDHPVPSRTRQLSPPSPRVLQRKAAGGQGVALAEGAFHVRDASRAASAEGPQGRFPLRAFTRFKAPILSGAGLPGRAGCARPRDAGPPDGPTPMAIGGAAGSAHVAPQGPQGDIPCGPSRVRGPRRSAWGRPAGPEGRDASASHTPKSRRGETLRGTSAF